MPQEEKRYRTAEEKPATIKDHAFFGVVKRAMGPAIKSKYTFHIIPLADKGNPAELHFEYSITNPHGSDESGKNIMMLSSVTKAKKLLHSIHEYADANYSLLGLESKIDPNLSMCKMAIDKYFERRQRPGERSNRDWLVNSAFKRSSKK
ncbi:hypothetical protein HY989_01720 [Candidatus Micrarchaeota archaeon]|nr:hypothetical protein [Candidatus Micrarchaeota archaeon]